MDIDVSARSYSVYVTPPGGQEITLADGYAFRTEQAGATYLANWGIVCEVGTHTVSNFQVSGPVHNITRDIRYLSVQAAIDAANEGDEMVLDAKVYSENVVIDGREITLRSKSPEDPAVVAATIIDGGGEDTVIAFAGSEGPGAVLDGLTITNGFGYHYNGAGLNGYGCHATVRRCVITGNVSPFGSGGGIAGLDGTINNCTISGNSCAQRGAGLYDCDGDIVNCIITNNDAAGSEADGGGLYGCGGTIRGCTITGNQAGWWGGGIALSVASITACTIAGNTSGGAGGGIYGSEGNIEDCLVVGNTATIFWGEAGGGLADCTGPIRNCTIAANRSQLSPVLPPASGHAGGLYNCTGPISNCVVAGNISDAGDGQIVSCSVPTYSRIEDLSGGGTGNISADPLFADPAGPDNDPATWADNDYHLLADSPCINAGNPAYVPCVGETDVDGQPRVRYGRIDMGADEFVLTGDANLDAYVNVGDLQALIAAWSSQAGPPPSSNWNTNADLNRDGYVNVADLQILAANWAGSLG